MTTDYKKALLSDFFDKLSGVEDLKECDTAAVNELRKLIEENGTNLPKNQQGQAEVIGLMKSFFSDHQELLTPENMDLLDDFANKHFTKPEQKQTHTPKSRRK